MAKRIKLKKGDVFSVTLDNNKRFFQYITDDLLQLNSEVIRVFKPKYSLNEKVDLSDVVQDEIDFVAHSMIKLGVKMKLWNLEGNIPFNEDINTIFRDTNDYGSSPNEQVKISNNWYIWKIGDNDFKKVGTLKGDNRNSEIGIVINPMSIVHRVKTGEYDFTYPDFE